MTIENDPNLERDLQALCRTPEFRRIKRYVFAAYTEAPEHRKQPESSEKACEIASFLEDRMLEFDPKHGV